MPEVVEHWGAQSVGRAAIHLALRKHAYRSTYSAVRDTLTGICSSLQPDMTVPLTFAPLA